MARVEQEEIVADMTDKIDLGMMATLEVETIETAPDLEIMTSEDPGTTEEEVAIVQRVASIAGRMATSQENALNVSHLLFS